MRFLLSVDIFLFQTNRSGILSEWQTVWNQLRRDLFVEPELSTNGLQTLPADDKSK